MPKFYSKCFRNQFWPASPHQRGLSGQLVPPGHCYSPIHMYCMPVSYKVVFLTQYESFFLSFLFLIHQIWCQCCWYFRPHSVKFANGCLLGNHVTVLQHSRAEAKFCPLIWSWLHTHSKFLRGFSLLVYLVMMQRASVTWETCRSMGNMRTNVIEQN